MAKQTNLRDLFKAMESSPESDSEEQQHIERRRKGKRKRRASGDNDDDGDDDEFVPDAQDTTTTDRNSDSDYDMHSLISSSSSSSNDDDDDDFVEVLIEEEEEEESQGERAQKRRQKRRTSHRTTSATAMTTTKTSASTSSTPRSKKGKETKTRKSGSGSKSRTVISQRSKSAPNIVHYLLPGEDGNHVDTIHCRMLREEIVAHSEKLFSPEGHGAAMERMISVAKSTHDAATVMSLSPWQWCEIKNSSETIGIAINVGFDLFRAIDWAHSNVNTGSNILAVGCHAPADAAWSEFAHGMENQSPQQQNFPILIISAGAIHENNPEPRLIAQIEHEHGFAWAVRWMPMETLNTNSCGLIGILACSFSNGHVCIYGVPAVEQTQQPVLLRLSPLSDQVIEQNNDTFFDLDTSSSNEQRTSPELSDALIFHALDWSPDCRFLVGGAHNGNVVLWKVNLQTLTKDAETEKNEFLTLISNSSGHYSSLTDCAIRSISWCNMWNQDKSTLFATASNNGTVNIWDVNDIVFPHSRNPLSRGWATEVVFPENCNALVVAAHDRQIRQFDSRDHSWKNIAQDTFPIWSVSCNSSRGFIVYGTAGGALVMSKTDESGFVLNTSRKRRGSTLLDHSTTIFNVWDVELKEASSETSNLEQQSHQTPRTYEPETAGKQTTICLLFNSEITVMKRSVDVDADAVVEGKECSQDERKTPIIIPDRWNSEKSFVPPLECSIFKVVCHPSKAPPMRTWLAACSKQFLYIFRVTS